MIGAKQVGAVFVANISRLFRQLIDFEVLRIIAAANHTLIYTDGRFVDPADSNDIVFSQLNAMLAAHENRQRVRVMSRSEGEQSLVHVVDIAQQYRCEETNEQSNPDKRNSDYDL